MRAKHCVLAISILLLLTTAARADEIIYFTNGTHMKILGHDVRGDMIKVVMDGNGSMGFPTRMVDRIENGGGIVYGGPEASVQPNQMVPGVRSEVVGNRSQQAIEADPDTALRRAQASRMQPTELLSGQQAQSQFLDGRILDNRAPAPAGTRRVGNHLTLGTGGREVPFVPQRMQLRADPPPPPPQKH